MSGEKIKEYLDSNHVKYTMITHSLAYTALEISESAHISAKNIAKTVIVKIDDKLAMVVLPANGKVDSGMLKNIANAKSVDMASEYEFQEQFPDCEVGAMPPFGNLYDMPVYVSEKLTQDEMIAFNAGNHSELMQLRYEDYSKLVQPTVIDM